WIRRGNVGGVCERAFAVPREEGSGIRRTLEGGRDRRRERGARQRLPAHDEARNSARLCWDGVKRAGTAGRQGCAWKAEVELLDDFAWSASPAETVLRTLDREH